MSGSIRAFTDPVTGRTTYTNAQMSSARPSVPQPRPISPAVIKPPSHATPPSTRLASAQGYLARSAAAKHAFEVRSGFPQGRSGYVVDHIIPLACHGPDLPSNMQWQTIAAGKAKDKVERKGCAR